MDERSTLGDVNKSSLTFQVDGAVSAGNTSNMSGEKHQVKKPGYDNDEFVRWNKRTDSRLQQKNTDYSFGMFQLSLVTVMVLLPVIIFHIYEFIANMGDSERLLNSIKLFSLTSEMWNVNNLMRQALISTILWNNTKQMLGQPSADAYIEMSNKIRNTIVPDILKLKTKRLTKDFQTYFANITTDYKVCPLISKYGTGIAKCGDNTLTAQDINFVMFLRSLVALNDDVFETWKVTRSSSTSTREIMQIPKFKNFIGITHNYSIVRDIYYIIMAPLSASVLNLLDSTMATDSGSANSQDDQNQRWQYYIIFVIPITMLTALAFYNFVYKQLMLIVFSFWHTAFLIPMNLIKKNALLDKFFKDLAARSKTKISFF